MIFISLQILSPRIAPIEIRVPGPSVVIGGTADLPASLDGHPSKAKPS